MNINEYISSGILEQYINGTASLQEKQEVECMSHIYPEIKTELDAMQHALESLAQASAVAPPAHLRQSIFDAIDALEKNETPNSASNSLNETKDNSENIAAPQLTHTIGNKGYRSAAAVLFLVSAGLGYLLFNAKKESSSFANDLAIVKKEITDTKFIIENKESQVAILQNKSYTVVPLAGIPAKSVDFKANVFYNKSTKDVFVRLENLPKPAAGKQYQLWAIADGKPVDLGMIDLANTEKIMQKMKSIDKPQAFAITLEKEGGVPSPTMDQMYTMGGV